MLTYNDGNLVMVGDVVRNNNILLRVVRAEDNGRVTVRSLLTGIKYKGVSACHFKFFGRISNDDSLLNPKNDYQKLAG